MPHCGACGLKSQCLSPVMPVDGKGEKRVLIVGEAPGQSEDEQNKPLVGKAGSFLRDRLEEIGISMRRDCWLTNSLRCRPPNNKIGDIKRIDYCRPLLLKAIRELQPHTIVLLGAVAVKSLVGWIWKENTDMGIMRWYGWQIPLQKTNTWICPVWHPSFVMREGKGKGEQEVKTVLYRQMLTKAFSHSKRPWKKIPSWKSKVEVILDPEEAAEALLEFKKSGEPIAFDSETTTLKPDGPYADIYSFSVSGAKRNISFPWYGVAVKAAKELMEAGNPKYGYNAKFDLRYLRRFKIRTKNLAWDSMIAAHVLDNRKGTKSLKFQSFVHFGMDAYEETISKYLESEGTNSPNNIKKAPLQDLLLYGGLDTLLTYKLAKKQMKEIGVQM